MFYKEFSPSPTLAPFVECVWQLEVDNSIPSPERIIPDGNTELIIHYGDCPKEFNPNSGQWEHQGRVLFAGQRKNFLLLETGKKSGMIGVRFHPAGAAQFLKVPMSETSNAVLDLSCWSPKCIADLEDQILEASGMDRVKTVIAFLETRLLALRPDFIVNEIANLIRFSQGKVDYRKFTAKFNISERQIERRFLQSVGIGPKQLARTIRFQSVLEEIARFPEIPLTDIAMSHDYFDQSHFIREFKGFTGLSPKVYVAETHKMNDFFVSPS